MTHAGCGTSTHATARSIPSASRSNRRTSSLARLATARKRPSGDGEKCRGPFPPDATSQRPATRPWSSTGKTTSWSLPRTAAWRLRQTQLLDDPPMQPAFVDPEHQHVARQLVHQRGHRQTRVVRHHARPRPCRHAHGFRSRRREHSARVNLVDHKRVEPQVHGDQQPRSRHEAQRVHMGPLLPIVPQTAPFVAPRRHARRQTPVVQQRAAGDGSAQVVRPEEVASVRIGQHEARARIVGRRARSAAGQRAVRLDGVGGHPPAGVQLVSGEQQRSALRQIGWVRPAAVRAHDVRVVAAFVELNGGTCPPNSRRRAGAASALMSAPPPAPRGSEFRSGGTAAAWRTDSTP